MKRFLVVALLLLLFGGLAFAGDEGKIKITFLC